MLNYNPSQLTDNVTLLEEFHKIQSYLTEHPLYQQYGSQAIYQAGKTDYSLDTVIKPEGSKLGVGDVVIFSNVYYGIVTAVSETTFTVETAVNFRGMQGEQGKQGETGPQGPTGATGPAGKDGQDGFGTFAVFVSQKLIPSNTIVVPLGAYKRPAIDDTVILISSYAEQYVAYSQIAMSTIRSYDALNGQATVRIGNVIDTKGGRGSKGDTGAQGPQGEAGNAMYIYDGLLDSSVANVQVSQITIPTGRTLQAEDILISSYESSVGAMAQVVAIAGGVATVDFIGQISAGGSGGTTLNRYTYSNNSLLDSSNTVISYVVARVIKIVCLSKGKISIRFHAPNASSMLDEFNTFFTIKEDSESKKVVIFTLMRLAPSLTMIQYNLSYVNKQGNYDTSYSASMSDNNGTPVMSFSNISKLQPFDIIYYNDTEITA